MGWIRLGICLFFVTSIFCFLKRRLLLNIHECEGDKDDNHFCLFISYLFIREQDLVYHSRQVKIDGNAKSKFKQKISNFFKDLFGGNKQTSLETTETRMHKRQTNCVPSSKESRFLCIFNGSRITILSQTHTRQMQTVYFCDKQ